jgi:two-component system response regulator AtoC
MEKNTSSARRILLVDDEKKFLDSIAKRLSLLGYDPIKASNGRQALELAQNNPIDMAIVDLKMPEMDGLVTITKLKEINPDLRSVLLTGYGDEKIKQATESLSADYFEKDQMAAFWNFIKRSSKEGNLIVIKPPSSTTPSSTGSNSQPDAFTTGNVEIIADYQSSNTSSTSFTPSRKKDETGPVDRLRIIGETPPMQELKRNIDRLAALDCPVIIRGETGTGKELAARVIHNLSPRRDHRFMAINCGCFNNDILIEELFRSADSEFSGTAQGHRFTDRSEIGGTLLLDQIEDMSSKMQLTMLKLVDSKKNFRQESTDNYPFDVRILVASQYNLRQLVEEGRFRKELYHRLNIFELRIPPLRERKDDIMPLCGYFLARFAKEFNKTVEHISDEVLSTFMSYEFPGNVRELEHIIERAVILVDGNVIKSKHLPERFLRAAPPPVDAEKKFATLAEMEKRYILEVLEATGGNKTKAVELLGISRAALWRKLKQFKAEKQHGNI